MPATSTDRTIAVIGSHGLNGRYGGWDQLVNHLVSDRAPGTSYWVFNPRDNRATEAPAGVRVIRLPFRSSGFEGIFFDFASIALCFFFVDCVLLLGAQGIPLAIVLKWIKRTRIVVNVGGIEWERPRYSRPTRWYLRKCFEWSCAHASCVILDNEFYRTFLPRTVRTDVRIVGYGGEIDHSLTPSDALLARYPFLRGRYFLAVARALSDNRLVELCEAFIGTDETLVIISNLSSSPYGRMVKERFADVENLVLIDGLYDKAQLDLIRRHCHGYVHSHTLCGTAPSLVEMVVARRPILSIDVPQNRYTLQGEGLLFADCGELRSIVERHPSLEGYAPSARLADQYAWPNVVRQYESCFVAA